MKVNNGNILLRKDSLAKIDGEVERPSPLPPAVLKGGGKVRKKEIFL